MIKKKIEYIWDYYRFHILIGVFSIYVLFSIVNHWFVNPPKNVIARIIIFDEYISAEKTKELEKFIESKIEFDPNKEEIKVESWDLIAPLGLDLRLKVMVAAKMVDALISGEFILNQYMKLDMFEELKGDAVINNFMIGIENNGAIESGLIYNKEAYLGIVKNSSNKEIVKSIFAEGTIY